jgi:hypothetical protein
VNVKKSLKSKPACVVEKHTLQEKPLEKRRSPKKSLHSDKLEKPSFQPTPLKKETPMVDTPNESTSQTTSKVTSTKSKPFSIRETPKKHHEEEQKPAFSKNRDSPNRDSSPRRSRAKILFDSETTSSQNDPKIRREKYNENEVKMLSNTGQFEHTPKGIETVGNENIRKSMNNLHSSNEAMKTQQLPAEDRSRLNESKQSNKMPPTHPSKGIINNSSSQSSLGNFTGIMDLGGKKKPSHVQSAMHTEEDRRHETLKVEQQTSKPLMAKTSKSVVKRHDTMNSFEDDQSVNPTLTANTIVKGQSQSSDSDHEEQKPVIANKNTIKVEKQQQTSSEEDEGESEGEEESDEEEFPVALNSLVFSFLPQEVALRLNDEQDWKRRVAAIQEMENLIKREFSRPNDDFPIYITDICKKMMKMMHDSNFKISLTSLRIIHNLCMKYPKQISEVLNDLIRNLSNKLSDNKIVIRHAVLKVFYALSTALGSKKIVGLVYPFLKDTNWHIREEILSILIMACLTSNST